MDCPFDAEYLDHKLLYYSDGTRRVLIGSLLSAIMAAMLDCFRESVESGTQDRRPAVRSCAKMLSLFMLHGIDFEGAEFQHLWMDYDETIRRWNVHEFPYSVSTAKRELMFLQRVCKKALRRHPVMVMAVISDMVNGGDMDWLEMSQKEIQKLLSIFEAVIIPFAVYDAMIFESMNYANPITPEGSSPESDEFVFEYQQTPVLYD